MLLQDMMEGIYDILNHLTGETLFTHQIPRAMKVCSPYLLQQHPKLLVVDVNKVNEENWEQWINEQVKTFGEYLPVDPLVPGRYQVMEPIEEAKQMKSAHFDKSEGSECV
ncbi:hypothetical protein [Brevibacillus sp. 179-C9.3 HS]|uniref:DUF7736 domain-containing protein n=1 Tax=unclassified Brevibacillus TaxID=2684853 RepID=UPI00399F0A87